MRSGKVYHKAPKSFSRRLFTFFVMCWGIPILVLITFMTISYSNIIINKTQALLKEEVNNVSIYASTKINEAITVVQKPSYDGDWEVSWRAYNEAGMNQSKLTRGYLYSVINTYFKGRLSVEYGFESAAFYLWEERELLCFLSKNSEEVTYIEEISPAILDIVEADDSNTILTMINGRIFIIRNLYTIQEYKRYGVLVVELNSEDLIVSHDSFIPYDIILCINDSNPVSDEQEEAMQEDKKEVLINLLDERAQEDVTSIRKVSTNSYMGYLVENDCDKYNLGVIFLMDSNQVYSELYYFYKIIAVIIILITPILIYALRFFKRQIQLPVKRIVAASEEIEHGKLGTTVSGAPMPNAEFDYLMNSFNNMSKRVKYLYDYAYDEKLASKDAKIIALQSQINPHFLNNTLEMMNWQARMSGDITVCKMIEALGTVLDYRMSRSNTSSINLAEELKCADAFIYITKMRFGQRLQVEKEIDEGLLQMQVPRLILQPILENAVIHGVERVKSGSIKIKIFHDRKKIYLTVVNTGCPSKSDLDRILGILAGDEKSRFNKEGSHTSLGIYNVNERIRLIYGDEFGLTIDVYEEDKTISIITLPYEEELDSSKDKEKQDIEDHFKDTMKIRL